MSDTSSTAGTGQVPLVSSRLPRLRERLSAADGLLLCLDFDGTLAPIVPDPDAAAMEADTRRALERLVGQPAVEVAIVSGRSLADLRDRVPVDGVHYAGNHGMEAAIDGERSDLPEAKARRPSLELAVETLRAELADVPGCEIEDKGLTATVHYRQVPDGRIDDVEQAVTAIVADGEGLQVTRGKQILEIRPDVECGKDRAVARLASVYDHLPMYVGDDVTDEDAFRELAPEGVTVHVGPGEETHAGLRVQNPDGCTTLLDWLADTCENRLDGRTA